MKKKEFEKIEVNDEFSSLGDTWRILKIEETRSHIKPKFDFIGKLFTIGEVNMGFIRIMDEKTLFEFINTDNFNFIKDDRKLDDNDFCWNTRNLSELEIKISEEVIDVLKDITFDRKDIQVVYNNKIMNINNCLELLNAAYVNTEFVAKSIAYKSVGSPRQIELNIPYKTIDGNTRTFIGYADKCGPDYKTAFDKNKMNVYTREDELGADNGRCTGGSINLGRNLLIENGKFVMDDKK